MSNTQDKKVSKHSYQIPLMSECVRVRYVSLEYSKNVHYCQEGKQCHLQPEVRRGVELSYLKHNDCHC